MSEIFAIHTPHPLNKKQFFNWIFFWLEIFNSIKQEQPQISDHNHGEHLTQNSLFKDHLDYRGIFFSVDNYLLFSKQFLITGPFDIKKYDLLQLESSYYSCMMKIDTKKSSELSNSSECPKYKNNAPMKDFHVSFKGNLGFYSLRTQQSINNMIVSKIEHQIEKQLSDIYNFNKNIMNLSFSDIVETVFQFYDGNFSCVIFSRHYPLEIIALNRNDELYIYMKNMQNKNTTNIFSFDKIFISTSNIFSKLKNTKEIKQVKMNTLLHIKNNYASAIKLKNQKIRI